MKIESIVDEIQDAANMYQDACIDHNAAEARLWAQKAIAAAEKLAWAMDEQLPT